MSDNWTAGSMQDRFYEVTANLSMVGEKPAYTYRNHPFIFSWSCAGFSDYADLPLPGVGRMQLFHN